uniref:Uncharacterized protein n=1 Tax=Lactuca sativa TaxID=4236 RepID=A0A9R1UDZ4_LACSA|nr:hypothetical protein LSAT_V11C900461050 [Lactuca sativa]
MAMRVFIINYVIEACSLVKNFVFSGKLQISIKCDNNEFMESLSDEVGCEKTVRRKYSISRLPLCTQILDKFSRVVQRKVNPFDLKELRNLFPKTKHDKTMFTKAFHKRNTCKQNNLMVHPSYALTPLPVIQIKLSGSGLGAW